MIFIFAKTYFTFAIETLTEKLSKPDFSAT